MAGFRVEGNTSGNVAEVDSSNNLTVRTPGYTSGGVAVGGGDANNGSISIFSEVDAGIKNGVREVLSPEVDKDYRLRVAHDTFLDQELFNYTSQNTGKHQYVFTTLTCTAASGGITTNSGSITTLNTGCTFGTFAMFPVGGTQTIVCETSVAFSAQPNANTVIDFGLFQRGATTAFAPLDGVYFRMNSAGLHGVINSNGTEVTVGPFPLALGTGTFTYTNNQTNRFLIQCNNVSTSFWINNFKYGEIATPVGLNFPCRSQALPFSFRHAIVGGGAGAVTQALISDYRVHVRGPQYGGDDLGTIGNRILGSYQGLSGNTMGQLVAGTVTSGTLVKPTAAVPANAALTANLPNSLGGRIYETFSTGLAVNTDAIFASYQVPAGTLAVQGRRLKIMGVKLSAFVQTVVVGGNVWTEWCIAFGHNISASLANTETGSFVTTTSKAPRRVMLPELTTAVSAAQAVGTLCVQPAYFSDFRAAPIYVNPGEFVQLVGNRTSGAAVVTSGIIAYTYQFVYSWE
jgi:hypothetical protein